MSKKILIAYFSYTEHTREIAKKIQAVIGGDLFEIRPAKAYSDDYDIAERQARKESKDGFLPDLAEIPDNLADYDTIFIGTPNWFNKVASPVATFLADNDFTGKTIAPFCTHGGDSAARVSADLGKYLGGSHLIECLDLYEDGGRDADGKIREWLNRNGF